MTQKTERNSGYLIRRFLPAPLRNAIGRTVARCSRCSRLAVMGLLSLFGTTVLGGETTQIGLTSGFDLHTIQYPAEGRHLLIWLPSKYGVRAGHPEFAATVQNAGVDFWLIDLHGSYLAPTGRDAYGEFRPQHIKELIYHAIQQGWENIILGGESRGAALAMQAARQWQIENPGGKSLKGMLFYHPHLIEGYTEIGERARFHPIARTSNLPIYIFQPQHSTKFLHSQELIEQLETGGSAVYFHYLQGVRGGFHIRPAIRLRPREAEERALLGPRIREAVEHLIRLPTPEQAAAAVDKQVPAPTGVIGTRSALSPMHRNPAPPLRVFDENDQLFELADHRGEVILVNFWASWCGPCVKEIASLIRLVDSVEGQPFRILAVNVGESRAHVAAFLEELDIEPNFDLLFDPDGEAAKVWKVYAIPSNYLLDKEQRVRYGHRGALRWDKSSVIEIVQGLLD